MENLLGKHLHIIAFDIPFPANYGGVIDVFYKLVQLKEAGVETILHCFEYGDRKPSSELAGLCKSVYYYKRKTGWVHQISTQPYIVVSRQDEQLLKNLMLDDHPILFEGLHSCSLLNHKALSGRFKIYRESNIEHHYYLHLAKSTKNIAAKAYFLLESAKLWYFQKTLRHANLMLVVSQADTAYLKKQFPQQEVVYLPSFHPTNHVSSKPGRGDFALYHGKLSVAENLQAAEFLIKEVFAKTTVPFVVAGLNPPAWLHKLIKPHSHIKIVSNPDDLQLFKLIEDAHVNVLVSFQPTGLKLKLLNTLYRGRYCLVNSEMLAGTDLHSLCRIGNSPREMIDQLSQLFRSNFDAAEVEKRKNLLEKDFSNRNNITKLISYL
jgi:hypothetical protein